MATQPLVVIVGETASGKSALAMELAQKFNGEIICADSRTVYKGMDIGTAKPIQADRKLVKHHLLDLIEPNQTFTVAQFKELVNKSIVDIHNREKLPIMVGGSGLYVDAVIFDFGFADASISRDPKNPRHLDPKATPTKQALRPNTLLIGLRLPKEVLEKRINLRVEQMFKDGLVEEAKRLGEQYGWETEALQTPAYKAIKNYLVGATDLTQTKELFAQGDRQLAKKQRTWFKRNDSIQWVYDPRQAVDIATTFLNKLQ